VLRKRITVVFLKAKANLMVWKAKTVVNKLVGSQHFL